MQRSGERKELQTNGGRGVKGALSRPLAPRCDTQARWSQWSPVLSTYVSGGEACLGAALHAGLLTPAASLARGLGESLPRPAGSAGQLRVPEAAAGSMCAQGPLGWRRPAGAQRMLRPHR